jgi:hypothetical protein
MIDSGALGNAKLSLCSATSVMKERCGGENASVCAAPEANEKTAR